MDDDEYGFGKEITKMEYKGISDWFFHYQNPMQIWEYHKSFIFCEGVFIFGAIVMFIHALKKGGRWPYLYFAAIFHGLVVENLSYFIPHINNFWQAQGVFTFIERRLPLYIIFLYPVFYYHASWAMSKLKLKCPYSEYLAFGLLVVLIDMPYDIIGIKYLHWVWHDTDPNIADRHYWVPWNSYYFHACFAASFQFFFHTTRNLLDKRSTPHLTKWQSGTIFSEITSVIVASLFGMPGGCLLFLPIYHPLHDYFKIPSEVTSITLLFVFTVIFWKFDRKSNRYNRDQSTIRTDFLTKMLMLHLVLHYGTWLLTAIFIKPKEMISIGLHEPIGNCIETEPVETILWTLQKRKYLCASDYDEKYFDFHCLPGEKLPRDGSLWYTICGTDFENHAEYITILSLISFIAFMVFRSIHYDYDHRIIKRLTDSDRAKLEKTWTAKEKLKQK